MSIIFSRVTVTNDSYDETEFFVDGMPDSICELDMYPDFQDYCEDCDHEYLTIEVESFTYGEGETEHADEDFLYDLARLDFEDFRERNDVDLLRRYNFETT